MKEPQGKPRSRVGTVVLVLLTVLCLGFAASWLGGYFSDRNRIETGNSAAVEALRDAWSSPNEAEPVTLPDKPAESPSKDWQGGEAFATIVIPQLFETEQAIAEGFGDATQADWEANNAILNSLRFAHYRSSSMPGEPGNFAISGHRNGPGAVLEHLDTLTVGDTATVQTENGTYTYEVVQEAVPFDDQYTGFTDAYPLLDEGSDSRSDAAQDPADVPRKLMTVTSCGWWDPSSRVAVVFELVEG